MSIYTCVIYIYICRMNDEISARLLIADLEKMMGLEPGTLEFYR